MKENVIFISCDQLRQQALSCYGEQNINTPNIDTLADEGVMFTNALASTPLCCPARATIITGQHNNIDSVLTHEYKLKEKTSLLSTSFKNNGYKTIYLGKWYLDGYQEKNGPRYHIIDKEVRGGFDTFIGHENNNSQFDICLHGHVGEKEIDLYKPKDYETDHLTDLALENIDDNVGRILDYLRKNHLYQRLTLYFIQITVIVMERMGGSEKRYFMKKL